MWTENSPAGFIDMASYRDCRTSRTCGQNRRKILSRQLDAKNVSSGSASKALLVLTMFQMSQVSRGGPMTLASRTPCLTSHTTRAWLRASSKSHVASNTKSKDKHIFLTSEKPDTSEIAHRFLSSYIAVLTFDNVTDVDAPEKSPKHRLSSLQELHTMLPHPQSIDLPVSNSAPSPQLKELVGMQIR